MHKKGFFFIHISAMDIRFHNPFWLKPELVIPIPFDCLPAPPSTRSVLYELSAFFSFSRFNIIVFNIIMTKTSKTQKDFLTRKTLNIIVALCLSRSRARSVSLFFSLFLSLELHTNCRNSIFFGPFFGRYTSLSSIFVRVCFSATPFVQQTRIRFYCFSG